MAAKVGELVGIWGNGVSQLIGRWDLNHPPTSVGGISILSAAAMHCRLDINNPPTAVGGFLTFAAKPRGGSFRFAFKVND